ncbi:hypothetical protein [Chryseobacterium turcicum]|uniref:DUF3592 domain-containing protein n=1 Tax=Chryseobacterium turcicum TaxID=2898076 RepID=A0A9Q3V1V0_9FLAO|nr:hypothetical protein [Chryseobacterium turcicum]MCD1115775.1 hypothetical protein [Chryseobacterium turcicum]
MGNKKLIWSLFAFGLFFLFLAFKFFISELPDKNNIVKVSGLLENDIKRESGRRGKKSLIIKLKNYPEIDFMIGSVALDEIDSEELIDENKAGDSITFFVEEKDFRRKVLKTEKIPFPENILHPEKIHILEIKNSKSNYLLLEDYRKAALKNNYLGVAFFGILGILMFIAGIKLIQVQKNKEM